MCLYFMQKDFVMNIPLNTQMSLEEATDQLSMERCLQCTDVLPIQDLDSRYEGVVSTFNHEHYCKFTCVTKSDKSK